MGKKKRGRTGTTQTQTMALVCQPAATTARTGLLSLKFNQDQSCLMVTTKKGFRVWNVDPFTLRYERDLGGSVGLATMLFRTNIIALVGGGANPCFRDDRVMLWDDHRGQNIAELCFGSTVRGVEMVRDAVAVALDGRVLVYNFPDLEIAKRVPTIDNPRGLVDIRPSQSGTDNVLATLSTKAGYVEIHHSDGRVRTTAVCLSIRLSVSSPHFSTGRRRPPFFSRTSFGPSFFFFCKNPMCRFLPSPLFAVEHGLVPGTCMRPTNATSLPRVWCRFFFLSAAMRRTLEAARHSRAPDAHCAPVPQRRRLAPRNRLGKGTPRLFFFCTCIDNASRARLDFFDRSPDAIALLCACVRVARS